MYNNFPLSGYFIYYEIQYCNERDTFEFLALDNGCSTSRLNGCPKFNGMINVPKQSNNILNVISFIKGRVRFKVKMQRTIL